ncbi:hypothetical protein M1373_00975 [Candidatus Marsarchaeota archaeon]|nr:hypothetical protein [Candidatus Marsarchaeota archaeon]MCL5404240.1 hypothetical protein [Candidatus Marsarchaeota archaeon]
MKGYKNYENVEVKLTGLSPVEKEEGIATIIYKSIAEIAEYRIKKEPIAVKSSRIEELKERTLDKMHTQIAIISEVFTAYVKRRGNADEYATSLDNAIKLWQNEELSLKRDFETHLTRTLIRGNNLNDPAYKDIVSSKEFNVVIEEIKAELNGMKNSKAMLRK